MKKNIRNLSLTLLALVLSSPVFADQCNPFLVSVPNFNGGFTIGTDALYLQPSIPNNSYFNVFGQNVGTTNNVIVNDRIKANDPTYHWGFDVSAAYRIPCTGNDITATWTHLGDYGDTETKDITNNLDPRGSTRTISDSLNFKYDTIDLDVGQSVNFGNNFKFRAFAGARWAQVQENESFSHKLALATPVFGNFIEFLNTHDDSRKFNGVGPQIGFDGRYCLSYGFGLDANLTTSLLIGKTHNSSTEFTFFVDPFDGTITTTTTNTSLDDTTRIVPAVDGSLGLDYTYNFNNCDRSSVVVQAGWKVINYWDAVPIRFFNNGALSGNVPGNIAFQGPYAGIKVNL